MTTYYFKDNSKKLLKKDTRDAIAKDICDKLSIWYNDLAISRKETIKVLKDLFPTWDNDGSKIKKVPSTYEQFKTYESAIYRATYQNYDSIVDIEGQDLRSNNISGIYKASLVYDYVNINLQNTLDKILFDWISKGEGSAFISWKEDIVQIPVQVEEEVIDEATGEITTEIVNTTTDVVNFRGVDVKRIDPHNLYYDKTQRDNWEACGKIYRDFIPIQNILADTSFNLTPSEKKELKELIKPNEEIGDMFSERISSDTRVLGNCVEVLEYYGDYVIPGTYDIVNSAEIVIVAGKYVAKLEKSKRPKCPIVFDTYLSRPDTDRGQSPMKPATILNDVENMCIDLTIQAWRLNVDPVFLAPKGAFSKYTKLVPGKPIEYDTNILGGQRPEKVDFSSGLRGFDFQTFFKNKMEGATGITQYLLGSQEGSVRTASESTYIHAGASMRIAREAYLFQKRIILPIVKLHALYKKIYDTTDRSVRLPNGTYEIVDEEIRNGNYTFIIGDNQTSVEREAETQKLFQLLSSPVFQSLANIMDTQTSSELLKWILNRMNFKATNQLFNAVNMNEKIRELGQKLGVQEKNMGGFVNDVNANIQNLLPQIVSTMQEPR